MYPSRYLRYFIGLFFLFFGLNASLAASSSSALQAVTESDSLESSLPKHNEDLPMDPARQLSFTTTEGTWISVDVSPDGQHIVFDLMGDIYRMPFSGGKAEPLTKGMAYDVHPTYSPDGSKILFISDRTGSDNAYVVDLESMDYSNDPGIDRKHGQRRLVSGGELLCGGQRPTKFQVTSDARRRRAGYHSGG